ncbi:MAG: hypothetical protein M3151_09820 [Actinomycetota bacterium]|nr:hypothetical protein [Actinomycetota bacterium]
MHLLEGGYVPDLLITDSLMPRMTGLELVRSIRSSPNADLAKSSQSSCSPPARAHEVVEGLQTGSTTT